MAAVTSWYAIMNHCVLELLCGTIDTTELKEEDTISHTATDTQLPTATSDHSRTLSELHHNESAPVIMYLFSH